MSKRILAGLFLVCSLGAAACDSSPTDDGTRPQFDGRSRRTTTTTATTASDSTYVGPGIGEACDPETYAGPYRCIPDPNADSGYVVAY
jgi:hypothetical protein